jgi:hypothetical protein
MQHAWERIACEFLVAKPEGERAQSKDLGIKSGGGGYLALSTVPRDIQRHIKPDPWYKHTGSNNRA